MISGKGEKRNLDKYDLIILSENAHLTLRELREQNQPAALGGTFKWYRIVSAEDEPELAGVQPATLTGLSSTRLSGVRPASSAAR